MKVLVVGAGAQGAPCASILSNDGDTSAIVLADIDLGLATKVKDKIKSDKIMVKRVDAEETEQCAGLAATLSISFNQGIRQ